MVSPASSGRGPGACLDHYIPCVPEGRGVGSVNKVRNNPGKGGRLYQLRRLERFPVAGRRVRGRGVVGSIFRFWRETSKLSRARSDRPITAQQSR